MSHLDASIPLLKADITIVIHEDTDAGSAQRYLLTLGDNYFLISVKARALILALLRGPETQQQLESAFAAETGSRIPAATLITLANQVLPAALFRDTPLPTRNSPFVVSATLLAPRFTARMAAYSSWLFKPRFAIPLVIVFVLMHAIVMSPANHAVHGNWTIEQACVLAALFLASGLLHECGHIAACRHFHCEHGGIGFGLYYVFPVWYADVTHAWQLQRRQRAVVDLGGVYFQAIFLIAVDGYALATGSPVAFKLSWLIMFAMLFTLNPVFKFDGYWLLSDLSGLHNLHQQVRQSIATAIARAMRRQSVPRPTLQTMILHAYLWLSACYFVYIGLFLARELVASGSALLSIDSVDWNRAVELHPGDWRNVAAVTSHLLATLAWLFIITLASVFFLNRLRLGMNVIVSGIRDARALPSRHQSI